MERGDPGVGIGSYARLLASYGVLDRLERLVDPSWDRAERALERARLPVGIRMARS